MLAYGLPKTPLVQVVEQRTSAWEAQRGRSERTRREQVDRFMRETAVGEPVYGAEALQALWLIEELLGAGMVGEARELLQMRFPGTLKSRSHSSNAAEHYRGSASKRRAAARDAAAGGATAGAAGTSNEATATVEMLRKSRPRMKKLLHRIMAERSGALAARHRALHPSVDYRAQTEAWRAEESGTEDDLNYDAALQFADDSRGGGSSVPPGPARTRTSPRSRAWHTRRVDDLHGGGARQPGPGSGSQSLELARARARASEVRTSPLQLPSSPMPFLPQVPRGSREENPTSLAALLPSPLFASDAAAAPPPAAAATATRRNRTATGSSSLTKEEAKRQVQDLLMKRMAQRHTAGVSRGGASGPQPQSSTMPTMAAAHRNDPSREASATSFAFAQQHQHQAQAQRQVQVQQQQQQQHSAARAAPLPTSSFGRRGVQVVAGGAGSSPGGSPNRIAIRRSIRAQVEERLAQRSRQS